MSKIFQFWDWDQIFLFPLAYISFCCTGPSLRTWLETDLLCCLASSSVVSVFSWNTSTHDMVVHEAWIWHVPRPIFIPLETRLWQKRSRRAFNCSPSLSSFWNQPPQMKHRCWVMLNYSPPNCLKHHADNLLVHLSLHSCEGQWSFWCGNWLINHVSVIFFLANIQLEETMMHCSSASFTFQFLWLPVLPPG